MWHLFHFFFGSSFIPHARIWHISLRLVLFNNTFRLNYIGSSNINDANNLVKQFNYKWLGWDRFSLSRWSTGRWNKSSSSHCVVDVLKTNQNRNPDTKRVNNVDNYYIWIRLNSVYSFSDFVILCHNFEKWDLFSIGFLFFFFSIYLDTVWSSSSSHAFTQFTQSQPINTRKLLFNSIPSMFASEN